MFKIIKDVGRGLLAATNRIFAGKAALGDATLVKQALQCIKVADRGVQQSFNPDQKPGSATQPCPYRMNRGGPCDIDCLTLSDQTSGRKVFAKIPVGRRQLPPLPAGAPKRLEELRKQHDLVLEVVADFPSEVPKALEDQKPVKLQITTEYDGKCSSGEHPLVELVPLTEALPEEGPRNWQQQSPPLVQLMAKSGPGDKEGGPAKWLSPFWFLANDVKEFRVRALSCGQRTGEEARTELKGLVRVYRNDVYTLTCKIPAFKKWARERSASLTGDGLYESKKSKRTETFGQTTSEETSLSRVDVSQGEPTARSESAEQELELMDEPESSEIEPAISFKRNGRELEFIKFVNDLINLHQILSTAWTDIQHCVPKIGWSTTFELSLLEGEISGEWGTRATDKWKNDAYLWVERFCKIKFDVKVISYRMELSFGVDFSTPGLLDMLCRGKKMLECILKVSGIITGEASLSREIELFTNSEPSPVAINGESKLDINVHGRVTVLGYTCDAQGGVEGGVNFQGEFLCSPSEPPHIKGKFLFIETKLYARYIDGITGDHSRRYERTIFKEKVIWRGQLPA